MKLGTKKILFIGPTFFDYHKAIIESLAKQNHDVTFVSEAKHSFLMWLISKVSSKLEIVLKGFILSQKLRKRYSDFDIVFVIHGKWLNRKSLLKLKGKNQNAQFILYQWDSIKSNPNILHINDLFNKVFSFDYLDCQLHQNFIYKPLFYSKPTGMVQNNDRAIKYDILFFGKAHLNRLQTLETIKAKYTNSLKLKFVILVSPISYFLNRYIFKKIRHLEKSDFVFKPISRDDIHKLIQETSAIIDIEHDNQTGLTIRTFEVLALGKKLITTNSYIEREPFYNKDIIAIISRNNPSISKEFIENDVDSPIDISSYDIENWIQSIITM